MTSKHALSTGKILIKRWDFQKVKEGFDSQAHKSAAVGKHETIISVWQACLTEHISLQSVPGI